ncbi:MAG TPA: S26 family signal peptidase, partial [Bacteroidota bacterium]|nr:S26 family signal peptidase [Bacteroidota bacterium]
MTTRPGAIRYAGMLMVVILLALTLKIFVLDAVYVPGRSMEPAVLPGDFLVLDKTGYAPAALAFRTP